MHDRDFSKPQVATTRGILFKRLAGRMLIVLLLAGLCTGISFHKVHSIKLLPFFNPDDGEGFYWTESAFHFRHAQMVAEGKGIPSLDVDIQYPEGLDVSRYITPVMERVSGTLYRFLRPGVPLHVFLIYFTSIFSTLSVLAVFFGGRFLWRSDWAGFISACFYSFAPASFLRTTGAGFIREDFALPFIFFSFVCFVYCLQKDSPLASVIGSLFLTVGLAAWHVTQFYVFLFVAGFVIIFLLKGRENLPRLSFTIFTVMTAIAAVTLSVLRAKLFIFSPQMMMSYGLLVVLWFLPRWGIQGRTKEIYWGSLVVLVFFAAGLIIQRYSGSYSHVYSLILNKFRYFGEFPQDPAQLSFEAKLMWTAPYVSPTLREVCRSFSTTGVFGLGMLFWSLFRILKGKCCQGEIIVVYFTLITFLLFLVMHRMSVFVIFFLALVIGSVVLVKGRIAKRFSYVCVGVCLALGVFLLPIRLIPFRPSQNDVKDVIHFIKANSSEDEAVLSAFEFGPSVAAYARRPIILHSQVESKLSRDKIKEVYTALYRSEEDFYQLCKRYKASLFVYQADMAIGSGPGSNRYMVGAVSLEKDSAAFLFHFSPEKLKHFQLVHENRSYRIFRVGDKATDL